jgi:hypothetical protein
MVGYSLPFLSCPTVRFHNEAYMHVATFTHDMRPVL